MCRHWHPHAQVQVPQHLLRCPEGGTLHAPGRGGSDTLWYCQWPGGLCAECAGLLPLTAAPSCGLSARPHLGMKGSSPTPPRTVMQRQVTTHRDTAGALFKFLDHGTVKMQER